MRNTCCVSADGEGPLLYLSGPMTGYPDWNRAAFAQAAAALRAVGYRVWSPGEHVVEGQTWAEAMRGDCHALCVCDGVAFLKGWIGSRGAQIEVRLAMELELPVRSWSQWLEHQGRLTDAPGCDASVFEKAL